MLGLKLGLLVVMGKGIGATSFRFELVRVRARKEGGGGSPLGVRAKVLLERAVLSLKAPLVFPVGRGEWANSGFELELLLSSK